MNENTIQTNLATAAVEENLVLAADESTTYATTATVSTGVNISGVYKLKNVNSDKYATVRMGHITSGTQIMQYGGCNYERPMQWKIKHIGNGKHTIRPMHKLNLAMTATSSSAVCVKDIGDVDSSCISGQSLWTIEKTDSGYRFRNVAYSSCVLATIAGNKEEYSNLQLATSTDGAKNQIWTLTNLGAVQDKILLYKSVWETYADSGVPTRSLDRGDSVQIDVALYSDDDIRQQFDWSSNNSIVTVSNTGKVTVNGSGLATIKIKHKYKTSLSRELKIAVDFPNKAIIIVPGVMGSQIFAKGKITVESQGLGDFSNDFADGTRLWDPATSAIALVDEKIRALGQDSSGTPRYSTKVSSPVINNRNSDKFQYGATDIYRKLYNTLYDKFKSSGYDIVLYEYDWRKDPYETAKLLDAFITERQYGDIVFVSHSMGGIVSSYYLSLGELQRFRVDKHISIGTPYLGSVEMPDLFVTGAIREKFFENWIVSDAVTEVIPNIPAIYALFPFSQHFEEYLSYRSSPSTTSQCDNYEDTMAVLKERMANWNTSMANNAIANRSRLFLSSGKHITTLVNSYYIVGSGVQTTYAVCGLPENLTSKTPFAGFTLSKNSKGDGTVTEHSATINKSVDLSRIYYKKASSNSLATHVGMISASEADFDGTDTKTIDFIVKLIDHTAFSLTSAQLSSQYGITRG